jgi:hypothetical protein
MRTWCRCLRPGFAASTRVKSRGRAGIEAGQTASQGRGDMVTHVGMITLVVVGALATAVGPLSPATAATTTVTPEADAFVIRSRANSNRGATSALRIRNDVKRTYVRFNVTLPAGETAVTATLRVFARTAPGCALGAEVLSSASDWGETTITWNNQPALGEPLDTATSWSANSYVSFDVTSAVSGSGRVSFVLHHAPGCNASSDATFQSKEARNDPQLDIETTTTSTPSTCSSGIQVSPGDDIDQKINTAPAGSTVCVAPGTYTASQSISPAENVKVMGTPGASRVLEAGATDPDPVVFIVGNVPEIFEVETDNVVLSWLDISGSPANSSCVPQCGRGIAAQGSGLRVEFSRLHHNQNEGIGSGNFATVVFASELDHNGSTAAQGCCASGIKGSDGFKVTNSYVHDNVGNGIWCDVDCDTPDGFSHSFIVTDNYVTNNQRNGIRFEHGSGATDAEAAASSALITRNVVVENNASCNRPGGGIEVNSASNADVTFNELGGTNTSDCAPDGGNGIIVRGSRHPLENNDVTDNDLGPAQGYSTPDEIQHEGTGTVARNVPESSTQVSLLRLERENGSIERVPLDTD